MMRAMATKWTRLGEKLKAARVELGIEQQAIAAAIGVQRGAIRNIEQGAIAKITPTILAYARIVGWAPGSPERVLAGEEPVHEGERGPASAPADGRPSPALDLAVDVQESLTQGPLLKSQVVEVETPAGRVRATIVLRGEEGASPEDLLASLRAVSVRVSTEESEDPPKG